MNIVKLFGIISLSLLWVLKNHLVVTPNLLRPTHLHLTSHNEAAG